MKNCLNCKYNGKRCQQCLSCDGNETYRYVHHGISKKEDYIIDGVEFEQQDTEGADYVTDLDNDVEDALRKLLYCIFDLKPLELLTLQGIMQRKTLQEIADELTKLFEKNRKDCTRHHVFQLRMSMMKKIPDLKPVCLTEGQRKELKY